MTIPWNVSVRFLILEKLYLKVYDVLDMKAFTNCPYESLYCFKDGYFFDTLPTNSVHIQPY